MRLINGYGQLGSRLKELLSTHIPEDVCIYHTWNVVDKSIDTQQKEYEKFIKFIDNQTYNKLIFISTRSQNETWYTWFKQKAESYLMQNCENNCMILRLPTFIGKPCKLFELNATAWGMVELISIETAANEILRHSQKEVGRGKKVIYDIKGEVISAQLVLDILKTQKSNI